MPLQLSISPLQRIPSHPGTESGISLFIKRDDLLHPEIQGSKGRKLAAILPQIKQMYSGGVVTFGGAFSNHLHAVAVAGRIFGVRTTGLLRGEHADLDNPTLRFCQENGMTLHRLSKARFDACKHQGGPLLGSAFPDAYLLPEGGNTPQAVSACKAIAREIVAQLPTPFTPLYICVPAGTGCTAAGLVAGMETPGSKVMIFPVSHHGLTYEHIQSLLPDGTDTALPFELVTDYTFGGFARFKQELLQFVRQFREETNILPDPVYTAKMLFGIYDLLAKGHFKAGSTVVALHTGGLQGWEGFRSRYGDAGVMF